MTAAIAMWDWEREPLPDARVVVCRPGLADGTGSQPQWDAASAWADRDPPLGSLIVTSTDPEEAFFDLNRSEFRQNIIPALYAETQAGLSGVAALLDVQADRRALVLCPREALDLMAPGMWQSTPEQDIAQPMVDLIDLVVIVHPPEPIPCEACGGAGDGDMCDGCVRRREASCDHRGACGECHGSGVIEPWPLHPAHVRGIVEQCKAADVSVCFLGWGEWEPKEGDSFWARVWAKHLGLEYREGENVTWFRYGPTYRPPPLDGAEVMDLPAWMADE